MPQFLRGFREILGKHDAHGGYYGHASVGCLHVRPMVNLKNAEGVNKMAAIADEVFQLVMQHHGSMSGEHGDGIARSKYNKWLFGDEVYQGFLELKKLWDPDNILNPGKVVNAPELTENLRWGADYKMVQIQTHLDFSREGGFDRAIEMCNGAGVCRKLDAGTQMLPLPPDKDLVASGHLMIANPFRAEGVARLFATHPPMDERIARLERLAGGL